MNARASTAVRTIPGTLGAAAIALVVGLALVLFGPPPGDLPAHLYRTELVRDGVLVWDTFWYAGHYPLLGYSLLYYFPAALVGNDLVALVSAVASAALFASLAEREWGEAARWPARVFAVVACGPLFTGTYPYAAGLAAALGALKALQLGRRWTAIGLAAVTLGLSPLAFLYLCLAVVAAFLARHPRLDRGAVALGGALLALGLFQGALLLLYAEEAEYPFFRVEELLGVVVLSGLCIALTLRAERGRFLAAVFGLWTLAAVIAFLVPSPIGENVTRLRGIVLPLALLAAAVASYRPRWLAGVAVAGALAFTVVPYVGAALHRGDTRSADEAYWEPALDLLRARSTPDYRVEVVPTGDHWESYWLPRAGVPLARGWYRQLDIAQNPLFYEEPLEPEAYRAWLDRLGVRFVLLPGHAARPHRGGAGGRAPPLGPGRARGAGTRRGGHRLRGAGCRADPHRPRRGSADHARPRPHRGRGRRARRVPARRPLDTDLASRVRRRLPGGGTGRDDSGRRADPPGPSRSASRSSRRCPVARHPTARLRP